MTQYLLCIVFSLVPLSLFAQGVPVFDTAHLAEVVKIVAETQKTFAQLQAQLTTIQQMRTPMSGLQRYRLPAVPMGFHNTGQFPYANGVLGALNKGNDSNGVAWQNATNKLQAPPANPSPNLKANYASVELQDSSAIMAGWQSGQVRQYHGEIQTRIDALQDDTINGIKEPTASLDRLAVANMLRSRQQMANTQLMGTIVDQMIGAAKLRRDAETELLNMELTAIQDRGQLIQSLTAGSGNLLKGWSLP